eukprot:5175192-Pleurochrysis_carterae.AAC.1
MQGAAQSSARLIPTIHLRDAGSGLFVPLSCLTMLQSKGALWPSDCHATSLLGGGAVTRFSCDFP